MNYDRDNPRRLSIGLSLLRTGPDGSLLLSPHQRREGGSEVVPLNKAGGGPTPSLQSQRSKP
jgi:hypothetical protein